MLYRHIRLAVLLLLAFPLLAGDRGNDSFVHGYAILGDHGYFVATREWSVPNVWRTDGTAAGTTQVTDYAGADAVQTVFAFRDKILYFVKRGALVYLGATDGTRGGSHEIREIGLNDVSIAVVHRDTFWFASGSELWKTDGTTEGTQLVKTFDTQIRELVTVRDRIFIVCWPSLGVSDGTAEGTIFLRIIPGARVLAVTDDLVVILEPYYRVLWRSDGTVAGTYRLEYATADPGRVAVLHDVAYIATREFGNPFMRRVVLRDGVTLPGSRLEIGFEPYALVATSTRVIALGPWPWQIWTYEGTGVAGQVFRIPDPAPAWLRWTLFAGEILYFGDDHRVWKTDGTPEGTSIVYDGAIAVFEPRSITKLGNKFLFSARTTTEGLEPWMFDESGPAGMIANIYKEGAIRGRMTGTGGAPVQGYAQLFDIDRRSYILDEVDENGRFALEGLRQGTYRLEGSSPGHLERTLEREIEIVPGLVVDGVELEMRRGGKVAGRIVGTDGRPVAGISVCVASTYGQCIALGQSGSDGTYETWLFEPGLYVVYTTGESGYSGMIYGGRSCAKGCDERSRGVSVATAEGETARADFVVRKWRTIRGRVRDALTGEVITYPTTIDVGRTQIHVRGGQFSFQLRDGTWTLRTTAMFYEPLSYTEPAGVEPPLFERRDFILTPKGGRIRGRVLDAATGEPASGVIVRVEGAGKAIVLSTRGDGTYATHPELAPGTYTVEAGEEMEPLVFTITRNEIVTAPDLAVTIPDEP